MTYETKNSWDNITYSSGFVRENKTDNKPRYDLIPRDVLKRLAELYARGAKVYWDRNWEQARGGELDTFKQSAFRHFMQWQNWETDEDHWVAAIWNVMWWEHLNEIEKKEKGSFWVVNKGWRLIPVKEWEYDGWPIDPYTWMDNWRV